VGADGAALRPTASRSGTMAFGAIGPAAGRRGGTRTIRGEADCRLHGRHFSRARRELIPDKDHSSHSASSSIEEERPPLQSRGSTTSTELPCLAERQTVASPYIDHPAEESLRFRPLRSKSRSDGASSRHSQPVFMRDVAGPTYLSFAIYPLRQADRKHSNQGH